MSRTPFRVRIVEEDGSHYDIDVYAVQINVWNDEPLEITTENGLTIQAPDEKDEEA